MTETLTTIDETREIGLDLGRCHGCMGCVELAPELFEWDDDNDQPRLRKGRATEEEVREVMACCPKDCIFLAD
jgi:ferredoxin